VGGVAVVLTLTNAPRRVIDNPNYDSYWAGRRPTFDSLLHSPSRSLNLGPDWFAAFLLILLWTALALGVLWLATWLHRSRKKVQRGESSR
jgi:hypothetical protein